MDSGTGGRSRCGGNRCRDPLTRPRPPSMRHGPTAHPVGRLPVRSAKRLYLLKLLDHSGRFEIANDAPELPTRVAFE